MYTFNDIKSYIKIVGWIYFLTLPLRRIRSEFVIERGNVYYFSLAEITGSYSNPSIMVTEATIDNLNKLKEKNPNIPRFRKFLENHEIVIVAIINEKIVGHGIFVKDIPKKFKGFINLRPGELWVADAYSLPEYRNKGIYSRIFSYTVFQARKRGNTKLFCDILANNLHSIEIHTKKFGGKRLFSYFYIKILFYEHTWIQKESRIKK